MVNQLERAGDPAVAWVGGGAEGQAEGVGAIGEGAGEGEGDGLQAVGEQGHVPDRCCEGGTLAHAAVAGMPVEVEGVCGGSGQVRVGDPECAGDVCGRIRHGDTDGKVGDGSRSPDAILEILGRGPRGGGGEAIQIAADAPGGRTDEFCHGRGGDVCEGRSVSDERF